MPIHPFPLRQERIKEEFQNLFIQLEKGIRWGKGARTEIKKFKVCSFKLKINHKKELGAFYFLKKKILSKAGQHLVFGGRLGEQTVRPGAIFSPLHQVPQNKSRLCHMLPEFYNLELQLSNNSDSTTADLRDGRQTTKKIQ